MLQILGISFQVGKTDVFMIYDLRKVSEYFSSYLIEMHSSIQAISFKFMTSENNLWNDLEESKIDLW